MLKKGLFLTLLFILFSCEQIIEIEDISNDMVVFLAPTDNAILSDTNISFSWEPIAQADSYHLQIARPNFSNAEEIVEDTLISVTNYNKILIEGSYQWRVKAKNFGYETLYTTQNISIEN